MAFKLQSDFGGIYNMTNKEFFESLRLKNTDKLNVGIFWYFNNNVEIEHIEQVSKSSNLFDVGKNEVFVNPQKDHIGIWYEVNSAFKPRIMRADIISKYGNVEHNYYPRGRVTYYVNTKTNRQYYLVLLDKCFLNDKAVQDKIKSAFCLYNRSVKFETDGHYTCCQCRGC